MSGKFQSTINDITLKMQEHHQRNQALQKENLEYVPLWPLQSPDQRGFTVFGYREHTVGPTPAKYTGASLIRTLLRQKRVT